MGNTYLRDLGFVHRQWFFPERLAEMRRRGDQALERGVHEKVDFALGRGDARHERTHRVVVRLVQLVRHDLAVAVGHFLRQSLKRTKIPRGGVDHTSFFRRQDFGDASAETAGGAGDDANANHVQAMTEGGGARAFDEALMRRDNVIIGNPGKKRKSATRFPSRMAFPSVSSHVSYSRYVGRSTSHPRVTARDPALPSQVKSKMNDKVATGTCYCGSVTVQCVGDPAVVCVCHCHSCARWGSLNLATLYPASAVTITGELVEYTNVPPEGKEQGSFRKTCAKCRSNVLNDHPGMGLTDLCSGILDVPFVPTLHINYAEKRWSIKDGLPKFKDLPSEMGGSGEMCEE